MRKIVIGTVAFGLSLAANAELLQKMPDKKPVPEPHQVVRKTTLGEKIINNTEAEVRLHCRVYDDGSVVWTGADRQEVKQTQVSDELRNQLVTVAGRIIANPKKADKLPPRQVTDGEAAPNYSYGVFIRQTPTSTISARLIDHSDSRKQGVLATDDAREARQLIDRACEGDEIFTEAAISHFVKQLLNPDLLSKMVDALSEKKLLAPTLDPEAPADDQPAAQIPAINIAKPLDTAAPTDVKFADQLPPTEPAKPAEIPATPKMKFADQLPGKADDKPAVVQIPGTEKTITFDLMHTKQNCTYKGYQSTFCDGKADLSPATEMSGMVEKIKAQIDRALQTPDKASIYLAYFSFSNKPVQAKLCEALSKGVKVRIVLDAGSQSNIADLNNNKVCQATQNKARVSFLGGLTDQPWRLHHNKFLYVDPGAPDAYANINASSGNLSAYGTSLHEDHWITMVAPKESNLIQAHLCVMEGLEAATKLADAEGGHKGENDSRVASTYIKAREACYAKNKVIPMSQPELAIAKESVAMFFSPNANNEVFSSFQREIGNVRKEGSKGYLYVAIQHFLHSGIGNELIKASNAGVDVRIIMDDDVVTEKGEVKGVLGFLKNLQDQAPDIKVRYIETNHLAGGNGAMMHNKFALLNGKRVLSGAGQYTNAAMKNNWENFALTQVPELSRKYATYFKELWDESVDEDYVRAQLEFNEDITNAHEQPPISKPEPLHPEALKLIGQ